MVKDLLLLSGWDIEKLSLSKKVFWKDRIIFNKKIRKKN